MKKRVYSRTVITTDRRKEMENFGYVFATKMLMEKKLPVMFMYREESESEGDSGWRFLCGREEPESLADPNNLVLCDVEEIAEIDGTVLPYLNAPVWSAFDRAYPKSAFVRIEGFDFGRSLEKDEVQ